MSTTPLTPLQLQKAQAEAEGYQQGPFPPLNLANQNTQATLGNPQLPETGRSVQCRWRSAQCNSAFYRDSRLGEFNVSTFKKW